MGTFLSEWEGKEFNFFSFPLPLRSEEEGREEEE